MFVYVEKSGMIVASVSFLSCICLVYVSSNRLPTCLVSMSPTTFDSVSRFEHRSVTCLVILLVALFSQFTLFFKFSFLSSVYKIIHSHAFLIMRSAVFSICFFFCPSSLMFHVHSLPSLPFYAAVCRVPM